MTLHQLKIFVVAARRLSLTAAAEELRIAQPSVSQQLRLLEEEFGKKFHRKIGRSIELTEQGWLFLKDAEKVLAQVEKLREKFTNTGKSAPGALTVGGTYGPAAILLPSALAIFKKAIQTLPSTVCPVPAGLLKEKLSRERSRLPL